MSASANNFGSVVFQAQGANANNGKLFLNFNGDGKFYSIMMPVAELEKIQLPIVPLVLVDLFNGAIRKEKNGGNAIVWKKDGVSFMMHVSEKSFIIGASSKKGEKLGAVSGGVKPSTFCPKKESPASSPVSTPTSWADMVDEWADMVDE